MNYLLLLLLALSFLTITVLIWWITALQDALFEARKRTYSILPPDLPRQQVRGRSSMGG